VEGLEDSCKTLLKQIEGMEMEEALPIVLEALSVRAVVQGNDVQIEVTPPIPRKQLAVLHGSGG
jgi:hypothetical protein